MALAYGWMKKFWYFHDNAPAHRSATVMDWVKKNLKRFEWPSSSPDLNPLDYGIWSLLDAMAQSAMPKTIPALKMAIIQACREIPMEQVHATIRQFPVRLQKCLDNGGERFEYQMRKRKKGGEEQ